MIDTLAHALTARLLAAIVDEADEATLKAALVAYPAIVAQAIEEAMKLAVAKY